jgi:hypothetical protein
MFRNATQRLRVFYDFKSVLPCSLTEGLKLVLGVKRARSFPGLREGLFFFQEKADKTGSVLNRKIGNNNRFSDSREWDFFSECSHRHIDYTVKK